MKRERNKIWPMHYSTKLAHLSSLTTISRALRLTLTSENDEKAAKFTSPHIAWSRGNMKMIMAVIFGVGPDFQNCLDIKMHPQRKFPHSTVHCHFCKVLGDLWENCDLSSISFIKHEHAPSTWPKRAHSQGRKFIVDKSTWEIFMFVVFNYLWRTFYDNMSTKKKLTACHHYHPSTFHTHLPLSLLASLTNIIHCDSRQIERWPFIFTWRACIAHEVPPLILQGAI